MATQRKSYNLTGPDKVEGGLDNIAYDHETGVFPANVNNAPATQENSPDTPEEDEGPARETWDSPIEFLLSCVAMSVGLGNIWRFPYTAFKNGGGAFLIPYLIVLTFIGRPIYFLELALGQFCSFGQVKAWRLAPLFKGVGYGAMIGTMCVVSYYASIMGLTVFYFFASFQKDLPWSMCSDDWVAFGVGLDTDGKQILFCNDTDPKKVFELVDNETMQYNASNRVSVAQLYFENEVLKQTQSIDDGIGAPEWRLTLCLIFSWILIWGSLIKGVSSSGKVAYFTALFPYVVLTIMLVRGATLPGAWTGIKYFITPQWEKMLEGEVWYAAVGQCFFSLSTGFGPIIMFASYNPFKHNVYKDAWIISALDTFTSLFAGFTIFAVLGYLSEDLGVPIEDVAKGGPGLAFISFAQGLATFDWVPQLFSVLFYLMLFTLGVGSATSLTGGIITIICDQFEDWARWKVTTGVCTAGLLVGLIYCTPGGQFMLELVDHFGANFVIYIMATVEVMTVAWVYGLTSFIRDIEFMLDVKIGWYWKFCWGFFIPVALSGILVYSLATEKRLTYSGFAYPDSAIAAGWTIAVIAVLTIPVCAIHAVKHTKTGSTLMERIKGAMKPKADFGPRSPKLHREWVQFKANYGQNEAEKA